MMVLFSFYVGNFGSYNETHVYQSLFGKGEVEPIGVLWRTRRPPLRALFARNASKTEEAGAQKRLT
jgi:hypothetical protein